MKFLQGRVREYSWGSHSAIPQLFGYAPHSHPVAELWFGAHPTAPSFISDNPATRAYEPASLSGTQSPGHSLADLIATDPNTVLGRDIVARYGSQLPFLLKLIAPDEPLSLQVHPSLAQAQAGFARENDAGLQICDPMRCYPDANHKPEMVYALSKFEALVGFRSPRRILSVLAGLDSSIARQLHAIILAEPNTNGVQRAFSTLISHHTRPSGAQVQELVQACSRRNPHESPSPRADALAVRIAHFYPQDPGVVASLLLNPVTLHPGEALFTPAGIVHAYISGLGVEVMAASDNVLRAGLTRKHMDVDELLRITDTVAAPPIRIAAERITAVQSTFYVPVDDFELSVVSLRHADERVAIRGCGPRIILCVRGAAQLWVNGENYFVNTGQSIFLGDNDGEVYVRGAGELVQVESP
ncbi:mannose-6-phosphate isomerase, class I [Arcanobacterium pinnipediorum]|uniref:mannose-6-phosphate isomerase n=1 Tax=Arcanobacterium pinnipediorum TaxID=1503041 RepID=A0ABY5AGD0_9ACTO|nr:mannose-6-phosphate isomerase, class I [Arcanobacterium pinnipediorum]USR79247.1 mannose-6-phosphate isomerase, class I [Arcanobacterium pinnipediorum]